MNEVKKCCRCNIEKSTSEFCKNKSTKDGYSKWCRECSKIYYQEVKHKYTEKRSTYGKTYYRNNKERCNRYFAEHRESKAEYDKHYRMANAERIAKFKKDWEAVQLKTNPSYKIIKNLRRRLSHALSGRNKSASTMVLLGCTPDELKIKLEKQFTGDMSWENYGTRWHIDHIKPCNAFNLLEESEQRACFHHSNLQPLLAIDNLKKGRKFIG